MRSEFKVRINTIDRVKMFVNICNTFDDDIDLSHGRYMIDAKSVMGIFSFDITRDLVVKIHTKDLNELARFNEEMKVFRVDD